MLRPLRPAVFALGLLTISCVAGRADAPQLPSTPQKPVFDNYHGTRVVDPYRWLENARDPAVRKWVQGQNRFSRAYLDALPVRAAIERRLKQLNHTRSIPYDHMTYQAGRLFALSGDVVVSLDSADDPDSEKIIVDAVSVTKKKTAVIDFFQLTPDSKRIAVSLSADGREDGTVYVFDVASGKKLADAVPNVKSPLGGSMIWKADGRGFYYTRNPPVGRDPKPDEPTQQLLYYHELGKDVSSDVYVWGKDLPPLADMSLNMSPDDKYVLASVTLGWASDQFVHYLIDEDRKVKEIGAGADKIVSVSFGADDDLYLLTLRDAPRGKIVRAPLAKPKLEHARTIVPETSAVIQGFVLAEDCLLVQDRVDGATRLRMFDREGRELKPLPVPSGSHVSEIVPLEKDRVLLFAQSYTTPPSWYHVHLGRSKLRKTRLVTEYPKASFENVEIVRELATSKDGTRVPLTILRRKGLTLNGQNPTLLTGYGGYGLTLNAEFEPNRLLWLEQGGVLAIAHLRGDGDFGENWHRAGILTQRQNAFDDFFACARHLLERKYTSSDKLAIEGASNGGLLMGAALTQQPNLFRVVVAQVGIFDILRHELKGRGFDVPEFGTVKNPAQFKAMYAYSPYHRVVDRTPYPAVLIIAGENDGRVDPTDSWRMAARLQAATSSQRPVLLWTGENAGHQISSAEVLSQRADIYAFLFQELGLRYHEPKSP